MQRNCELCGEGESAEMAEMYQPFNAFVTVGVGRTRMVTWEEGVRTTLDLADVDTSAFTSSGPVFICPDCGNTDGGSCGCPGLSVYCHAQCGLSRGYEVA